MSRSNLHVFIFLIFLYVLVAFVTNVLTTLHLPKNASRTATDADTISTLMSVHHPKYVIGKRQEWDQWFGSLNNYENPFSGNSQQQSINISAVLGSSSNAAARKYNIIYYHVMKTGGTSLYKVFFDLNRKNGLALNPGETEIDDQKSDIRNTIKNKRVTLMEKRRKMRNVAFQRRRIKQPASNKNRTEVFAHGEESPGSLQEFVTWKSSVDVSAEVSIRKLLVISFREPVERTISHYFQIKPCPNGESDQGRHRFCEMSTMQGIQSYLKKCRYAKSWQYQYLDQNFSNIDHFDALILNDRVEESLVLMSINFRIPIKDLFYLRRKVRIESNHILTEKIENEEKVEEEEEEAKEEEVKKKDEDVIKEEGSNEDGNFMSCTAQWFKNLIPPEKLAALSSCTHSCAGIYGRMIFTEEEIRAIEESNKEDLTLWNDYIIPRYERFKAEILTKYGVTQEVLDDIVSRYKKARGQYEEIKKASDEKDYRSNNQEK